MIPKIVVLSFIRDCTTLWVSTDSEGRSYHFQFGKKYHAKAIRFKSKKSILHKNKNKIVSSKSITKFQRLRAGYKHHNIFCVYYVDVNKSTALQAYFQLLY